MKKDESQSNKLERTAKRMIKTIVERNEKKRRVGDAVDDTKPNASYESQPSGSNAKKPTPHDQKHPSPSCGNPQAK